VERRKKILLVAAVLIAGLVGALQFRKSEFVKSHFPAASGWHFGPDAAPTSDHGVTAQRSDISGGPAATAFDGHIEAAPGTQLEPVNQSDLAPSNPRGTTAVPLVDVNVPDQTHTVIDGDTLQGLSQHYLGRADRYMELFQYNRDVLRSPEVLPIGAELRIPAQVALPPTSGAAALPSVPATPLTPLVPLPQMPAAPTTTPALAAGNTTLPVSAQAGQNPLRPNQRTYTVQAGDNLVDIARKFYGDGRRYESIYEANRRVMHNPTDLKPGMVLAIP
jgi:nucleoid-associated protein YgaU